MGLRAAAIACVAALTGCEGPRQSAPIVTAVFPDQVAIPRVMVYGGLSGLLPRYDVTPALQMFLYGPSREGKAGLRNPQGMAIAGDVLLVCDQGRADVIAVNLASGKSVGWCDEDHPPRCPVAVAADPAGYVYVADTTRRAVLVYAFSGTFVEELKPSPEAGRAFRPCAVAITGRVLHVGDLGGRCVARWSLDGREWLAPIRAPNDSDPLVAPTGLAFTTDGVLLIADALQGRVFRVTAEGRWLSPIGKPGRGRGEFVRPKQVCSTAAGLVLVSDAGRQSVLVFGADGSFVTEVAELQGGWRGFTMPCGMLTIADHGELIRGYVEARQLTQAAEYVLVSDSLGATSLTVLGVVAGEQPHAR